MRIVEALLVAGEADVLDAHLGFQLAAGVELVLAVGDDVTPEAAAILDSYGREGRVERVADTRDTRDPDALLLLAAGHGADWMLVASPGEFWLPRAESLHAVLEAVPPRYTIVQALARDLHSRPGAEGDWPERLTVRPVLGMPGAPPAELYQVRRVRPGLSADDDGRVPMRAWYPIEVFRPSLAGALQLDPESIARGLADGWLVVDERLRDALRAGPQVPSVVDDAAYAVECAAAGEVDLMLLDEQIRELEGRISELESRFWPRVIRKLTRSRGRRDV